jgi:carboxymethylenebutenolidase
MPAIGNPNGYTWRQMDCETQGAMTMNTTSILVAAGLLLSSLPCAASGLSAADVAYAGAMARQHADDAPSPSPMTRAAPAEDVRGTAVQYGMVDGKPLTGYLATPAKGDGPWPGIIVIHEWWGLNDNIRAMTRQLAGQGYAALAVDLYAGHVAANPTDARQLMEGVMAHTKRARANLAQAHDYLTGTMHAGRLAVIGWCFGGGWSLQTALMYPKTLDAAVIYYGRLVTDPDSLRPLKVPVIGFFGAEDPSIPPARVRAFADAMRKQGKSVEVHVYPGAGHAFANPSGGNYRPEAAADAWKRTLAFLKSRLAGS